MENKVENKYIKKINELEKENKFLHALADFLCSGLNLADKIFDYDKADVEFSIDVNFNK